MAIPARVTGTIDKVADRHATSLTCDGGASFTVPELLMLSAWAEFHGIRMVLELDNCVDGAEFEEVVALYAPDSPLRQWTLWRAPDAVVAEPVNGAGRRSACIADLLPLLMLA